MYATHDRELFDDVPHGASPRWFVLSQMYYNAGEVRKLLDASDVALVNYGLHYCQPARPGARPVNPRAAHRG